MANTRVTLIKKYLHPNQEESLVLPHHSAGTVFPVSVDHVGGGMEFVVSLIVLEPCDEHGVVLEDD